MEPEPGNPPNDLLDRVSALLEQVLEAQAAAQPDVLAEICARHPDCAAALRQGYGSLQDLDLLQVGQASPAGFEPAPITGGLPRTLGPFRLLELLGAGGMGAVYRAEDEELKRQVALKLVRSELLASARTRSRFQREAAALARLDHPGLCTVYRAGTADGQLWIAMRLVRGTTLAEQIERRRGTADGRHGSGAGKRSSSHARKGLRHTVLQFEKIARALATAHAVGVVHRDIKPANIVLTGEDEPVVIDFGLVHLEDSDSHLTISGDQIGTPAYMAPEQVDARGHEPAPTTDIYALAVTLFEALTLESPYQARSREELFQCIVRGKRRRLRQVRRDLPTDLELVLEKALDPEPARRYASMVEFADDLRRYLLHEPLMAGPPSAWYRLHKLVRRYPGPVAAGSAVFLTAVVGGVVALQFALREQAKVREFDLLSGVVLHEQVMAAERDLYPAWPHKIAAMEKWLRDDAGQLLAMRPDIERTMRALQARVSPWTDSERETDRRSHPRFGEWELANQRVAALSRAQAIRDGKEKLVEPELTEACAANAARDLNKIAWDRVAPASDARRVHGEEAVGLALARAAVAKAVGTEDEFRFLDTLAWALFANGQDGEAQATSAQAWAGAPEADKETYLGYQRNLTEAIARAAEDLATASKQLEDLSAVVNSRRSFRFESKSQELLHRSLSQLSTKIDDLTAKEKPDVELRLGWAKQIRSLSLAHPNARHTWAIVRAAIAAADDVVASKLYAGKGIELRDQDILGLVPIGMNQVTKLWEFYDLRSAWDGKSDPRTIAIPDLDTDGSIEVTGDLGIVFVLLPGGTFTMGAQKADPNGPNYDENARVNETPHRITLAPFFLARHEMTQGQWARLWTGDLELRQPSMFKSGQMMLHEKVTWANPVEHVSWTWCETLMAQQGLVLPTEAQWEYGCRAGTTTPWVCALEDLQHFANLGDATAKSQGAPWTCEAWSDGYLSHAPVGTFPANAFGIHDVHGNVWEWCRDEFGDYTQPVRDGDGLRRRRGDLSGHCFRGGSHTNPAAIARSAYRTANVPSSRQGNQGLRCARALRPLE